MAMYMSASMESSGPASSAPLAAAKPDGSSLCLACGMCCDGTLHAHVVVEPNEIARVSALGLKVEAQGDSLGFRQPCPLYRGPQCSIYANHPATCRTYQCKLLKEFLAGALTLEQATHKIRRARELVADVIAHLPPEYSFEGLRRSLDQDWDSGRGMFGSAEVRNRNAPFLLLFAKLTMYLRRHFRAGKKIKAN